MGIAGMKAGQGDFPGGLAATQAALGIFERLAKGDQTNAEWQFNLASTHLVQSGLHMFKSDFPAALLDAQETCKIMERLARQDPNNLLWQNMLAVGHQMAGIMRSASKDTGAKSDLQVARAIGERLEQMGSTRREEGDLAGAVAAYQYAAWIREAQGKGDEATVDSQRDLA